MEPEEAEDVRFLLSYAPDTAGGLMTTDPIILPPEATIAQALASARRADIPPALAAIMFVCRPPLETPTGRYLGAIHLQRALREPPSTLIGSIIDMAHVLGLHVVAEGVETTQQLEKLVVMDCDCVQGYVFSRPLPEAAALAFTPPNL